MFVPKPAPLKPTARTIVLPVALQPGDVVRSVTIRAYLFPHLAVHRPLVLYGAWQVDGGLATRATNWCITHRGSGLEVAFANSVPCRDVLAFAAAIEAETTSWPQQGVGGTWNLNLAPLGGAILRAALAVGLKRDRIGSWEKM